METGNLGCALPHLYEEFQSRAAGMSLNHESDTENKTVE